MNTCVKQDQSELIDSKDIQNRWSTWLKHWKMDEIYMNLQMMTTLAHSSSWHAHDLRPEALVRKAKAPKIGGLEKKSYESYVNSFCQGKVYLVSKVEQYQ